MRQHLAGMTDQHGQQPVFDGSQMNFPVVDMYAATGQINLQITDAKQRFDTVSCKPCGVAKRYANARQQFADAERFGQVIVRSGIQRG